MKHTQCIKHSNIFNKQHNLGYCITKMIKIHSNEVMCLAHGFNPFNLTVKLEGMTKVILTPKLDGQSGTGSKV